MKSTIALQESIKENFFHFNYDWQRLFTQTASGHKNDEQRDIFVECCNDGNINDKIGDSLIINNFRICEDTGKENEKVDKTIGVVNWEVRESDVINSLKGFPDKSRRRRDNLFEVLNSAIKSHVDILVFPEVSIPVEWFPLLVEQSAKNDMLIIGGLEYIFSPPIKCEKWENCEKGRLAYNMMFTIFPIKREYYRAALPILRKKNYYSPAELELIRGYHLTEPELPPEYHLMQWRNVYFSTYNCFELSNISDRAIFKSKVDFIAAIEYNRDLIYFSNITESWSRDLHCFIIQSNPSHYGDSRIVEPSSKDTKDIVRVKGGKHPVVMVEDLSIESLRNFNRRGHNLQLTDKSGNHKFKPTPAQFDWDWVERRIRNEKITEEPWISGTKN